MTKEYRIEVDSMKNQENIHHQAKSQDDRVKALTETENSSINGDENQLDFTAVQSVAEIMRQNENFKDYFKPKAFPIGPTHVEDPTLLERSKTLKMKLVSKFITENGYITQTLHEQVTKDIIKNNLLKDFFDPDLISIYNDDELAWLLIYDGCAVLQFIHSYIYSKELKELKIIDGDAALIREDLFLLENQVPYKLLKLIMENMNRDKKKEYLKTICMLVFKNNIMVSNDLMSQRLDLVNFMYAVDHLDRSKKSPIHLLDLLRSKLLGDHDVDDQSISVNDDDLDDKESYNKMLENKHRDNKMSFRNVQEMRSAGIEIKASDSENMKFVSFSPRWFGVAGQLSIPPINVDYSTARKLMNLVAYEMLLRLGDSTNMASYLVTSYVNFMDLLIDNEEDVKELRRAGILRHRLSSDSEVARLFNTLGSNCLLLRSEEDVYIEVKREIDRHCGRKLPRWTAEFGRNYCSSPWALISLVFVLVTAFLTLQQFSSAIFPRRGFVNNLDGLGDL